MPIGSVQLVMGSSDIPVAYGPHILLADDKSTPFVQGRNGQVEKLVPIAVSVLHEGLHSLHVIDDAETQTQQISMGAEGGGPLSVFFLEHENNEFGSIDILGSDFQYVYISDHPASLDVDITPTDLTFNSDRDISEIIYAGREGIQRQVLDIDHLPGNFTMAIGDDVLDSRITIGSISLMISNASDQTMDGDLLFMQNQDIAEATPRSASMESQR